MKVGTLYFTPSSCVSSYDLDGELVIYEERSGEVFVLNTTGAQIWRLLDGTRTGQAVAEEVSDLYKIEIDQVIQDVEDLIVDLTRAGLLSSISS